MSDNEKSREDMSFDEQRKSEEDFAKRWKDVPVPPMSDEEIEAEFARVAADGKWQPPKKDCGVPECDLQGVFHKHTHDDGSLMSIDEIQEQVRRWKTQESLLKPEEREEREFLSTAYLKEDGTIEVWQPWPMMEVARPGDKLYAVIVKEHKHLAVGKRSTLFRYPDGRIEEEVDDF